MELKWIQIINNKNEHEGLPMLSYWSNKYKKWMLVPTDYCYDSKIEEFLMEKGTNYAS